MDNVGIRDPEAEFAGWCEERRTILAMNNELRARSTRGGERDRAMTAETTEPNIDTNS